MTIPKNYQIWHHRREIAKLRDDCERELTFTENVFKIDPKNYHAWAHRQWALKHFNAWDNELAFTEELMEKDIRNNSAWNQRWFVVHNRSDAAVCERSTPRWTFVSGRWRNRESSPTRVCGITFAGSLLCTQPIQSVVLTRVQEFVESNSNCVHAISLMADLYVASATVQSIQEACGLFSLLATLDTVRS